MTRLLVSVLLCAGVALAHNDFRSSAPKLVHTRAGLQTVSQALNAFRNHLDLKDEPPRDYVRQYLLLVSVLNKVGHVLSKQKPNRDENKVYLQVLQDDLPVFWVKPKHTVEKVKKSLKRLDLDLEPLLKLVAAVCEEDDTEEDCDSLVDYVVAHHPEEYVHALLLFDPLLALSTKYLSKEDAFEDAARVQGVVGLLVQDRVELAQYAVTVSNVLALLH